MQETCVQERRLHGFGHVMRMVMDSCVDKCRVLIVEGTYGGDRRRKMWDEVVRKDLWMVGITKDIREQEMWQFAVLDKRLEYTLKSHFSTHTGLSFQVSEPPCWCCANAFILVLHECAHTRSM